MTPKRNLPTAQECKAYLDTLGYDFVNRTQSGVYLFKDRTGQRPAHNKMMFWSLAELREAVKFGC